MLQETKCRGAEAEAIFQRIWRACNSLTIDSIGASGGLAILWDPHNITINQPFTTISTITTHFEVIGSAQEGAITNVYGPHHQQDRYFSAAAGTDQNHDCNTELDHRRRLQHDLDAGGENRGHQEA